MPFARIIVIRFYDPGVEPVEPNPFRFAVVAVIKRRVATIKALCGGISPAHCKVGAKALKSIGVTRVEWRHDGVAKGIDIA